MRISSALFMALLAALVGCSRPQRFIAREEPWRAEDERQCLASGYIRSSPFVTPRSALGGPSSCGAISPLQVSAAGRGQVQLRPAATLRCPMVPATDHWVERVVIPAARHHLGQDVVELKVAASYACRPRNSILGAKLSEHGLANALDISAFRLADGRAVTVKTGWHGTAREQAFLRAVHRGACATFSTVLGPNADAFHRDHFHLDLARHGRDGRVKVCQ
jgi:hypothetical protein